MTPGARVAAAIELLDQIAAGAPAEKALTNWARANRYAGSKDRAAVRDHVFDALRCWRSAAWEGGAETGRGRMIGLLRMNGADLDALFSGVGHAPSPLTAEERTGPDTAPPPAVKSDLQDWVFCLLNKSIPGEAETLGDLQRARAPVFLRVLTERASLAEAQRQLAEEEIAAVPVPGVATALEVVQNARRVQHSAPYLSGLVELQDASAQALCLDLPMTDGARVMDYCAGGGGKILALADRAGITGYAHDAAPQRMADLPARAARAGAQITTLSDPAAATPYDLVLCDAPCSGSGTWRRTPEAKWRLSAGDLDRFAVLQGGILDDACQLVAPGGHLAYATCSLFAQENDDVVSDFRARHPEWRLIRSHSWMPGPRGDGFFMALLRRD